MFGWARVGAVCGKETRRRPRLCPLSDPLKEAESGVGRGVGSRMYGTVPVIPNTAEKRFDVVARGWGCARVSTSPLPPAVPPRKSILTSHLCYEQEHLNFSLLNGSPDPRGRRGPSELPGQLTQCRLALTAKCPQSSRVQRGSRGSRQRQRAAPLTRLRPEQPSTLSHSSVERARRSDTTNETILIGTRYCSKSHGSPYL